MYGLTSLTVCAMFFSMVCAGPLPYPKNHEYITTLTHDNFRELVLQGDGLWIVEYYAPWCGHCKSFAPEFEKAAKSLKGIIKFGAVNADDKNAAGIAQAYNVPGYPMIHLFPSELVEQGEGEYTKNPIQFQSERSANTLVKWAIAQMPTTHISKIADDDSEKNFIEKYSDDNMPKILLFSNKDIIAPLYISLSLDFKYRALFGFVPPGKSSENVRDKYHITKFPTIIALGEDDEFHTYDGEIEKAALGEFVSAHALPASSKQQMMAKILQEESAAKKKEKELKKMSNALKPVTVKSVEDWKKLCIERVMGLCGIALLDPNDSTHKDHLEILERASKIIPTKASVSIQFVVIDGPTNFEIANFFDISAGYPSLVFLQPKRARHINFIGSFSADNIVSFVQEKVVSAPGRSYETASIPTFIEPGSNDWAKE
eukprot:PhF_6_TR28115/c0_g1_i2/m.41590/K09584/PDIA6, TXNDC7; protein disulfide-isomerase A6